MKYKQDHIISFFNVESNSFTKMRIIYVPLEVFFFLKTRAVLSTTTKIKVKIVMYLVY